MSQTNETGFFSVKESHFPFLDRILDRCDGSVPVFKEGEISNVLNKIEASSKFTIDAQSTYKQVASGAYYWYKFLVGFLEFHENKSPISSNSFFVYLLDLFEKSSLDPGLKKYFENGQMPDRVLNRFKTMSLMINNKYAEFHPVTLIKSDEPEARIIIRDSEDMSFKVKKIDGYHRIFSAVVAGVEYIPYAIKDPKN